jgi:hypothetical protein
VRGKLASCHKQYVHQQIHIASPSLFQMPGSGCLKLIVNMVKRNYVNESFMGATAISGLEKLAGYLIEIRNWVPTLGNHVGYAIA